MLLIFQRLETIFQHAHHQHAPVALDDVARGVLAERNKRGMVTDIEYHPTTDFDVIAGAYEKVKITHEIGSEQFVAHIYYKHGDNYCWERFAKCKELCQLALDGPNARVSQFSQVKSFLRALVAPYTERFGEQPNREAIIADQIGVMAALEVLFPMRERLYFLERYKDNATRDALYRLVKSMPVKDELHGPAPKTNIGSDAPMAELLAYLYRIPEEYVHVVMDVDFAVDLLRMARDQQPGRFGSLTFNRVS